MNMRTIINMIKDGEYSLSDIREVVDIQERLCEVIEERDNYKHDYNIQCNKVTRLSRDIGKLRESLRFITSIAYEGKKLPEWIYDSQRVKEIIDWHGQKDEQEAMIDTLIQKIREYEQTRIS